MQVKWAFQWPEWVLLPGMNTKHFLSLAVCVSGDLSALFFQASLRTRGGEDEEEVEEEVEEGGGGGGGGGRGDG